VCRVLSQILEKTHTSIVPIVSAPAPVRLLLAVWGPLDTSLLSEVAIVVIVNLVQWMLYQIGNIRQAQAYLAEPWVPVTARSKIVFTFARNLECEQIS